MAEVLRVLELLALLVVVVLLLVVIVPLLVVVLLLVQLEPVMAEVEGEPHVVRH